MNFRYERIYHCLQCGNVVFRPPGASAPTCCDLEMTHAADKLVRDSRTKKDARHRSGQSRVALPTASSPPSQRPHDGSQ